MGRDVIAELIHRPRLADLACSDVLNEIVFAKCSCYKGKKLLHLKQQDRFDVYAHVMGLYLSL